MWRAFFFSFGTMLIILGVECLVVEQFVVQKARIPSFVAKILDSTSKNGSKSPNGRLATTNGYSSSNGPGISQFGPSRFEDTFATPTTGNYYGGYPSSRQQSSPNSQFSLAGFGKQQNEVAPIARPLFGTSGKPYPDSVRGQAKIIQPKDWMPWSLLAAGTLVVLYTNTTSGRGSSSE